MDFEKYTSSRWTSLAILLCKGCYLHWTKLPIYQTFFAFIKLQNLNTIKMFYIVFDMGCSLREMQN